MDLLDFSIQTELSDKKQVVKAKLLCYFLVKTSNIKTFLMSDILDLFVDAGFSKPNSSRLKKSLIEEKVLKLVKRQSNELEFIPTVLSLLNREIGPLFRSEKIESCSEMLDENKFNTDKKFVVNLVKQVNATYQCNCFDACAVIMRRLFEVVLILLYKSLSIDYQIKDSDNQYFMLDKIIKDAKNNVTLNLSRIKNEFDKIQKIGNYSAHRIEYIASRKDIDDIKIVYRTALEELFLKIGL